MEAGNNNGKDMIVRDKNIHLLGGRPMAAGGQ